MVQNTRLKDTKHLCHLDEDKMSNVHAWYLVKAMIIAVPCIGLCVAGVFVIAYWILN
jgi:hypothetical protein